MNGSLQSLGDLVKNFAAADLDLNTGEHNLHFHSFPTLKVHRGHRRSPNALPNQCQRVPSRKQRRRQRPELLLLRLRSIHRRDQCLTIEGHRRALGNHRPLGAPLTFPRDRRSRRQQDQDVPRKRHLRHSLRWRVTGREGGGSDHGSRQTSTRRGEEHNHQLEVRNMYAPDFIHRAESASY